METAAGSSKQDLIYLYVCVAMASPSSPSSPQTLELHRDGVEARALGPSSGLLPKQALLTAISQGFRAPAKPHHNRQTESREEPDSKHPPPKGGSVLEQPPFLPSLIPLTVFQISPG